MMNELVLIGIALILIGFSLVVIGSLSAKETEVEGGGIILIGPLPIIFGSSKKMVVLAAFLGIIILFLIFLFFVIKGKV